MRTASPEATRAVADALRGCAVPIVLDPVMIAKSGDVLAGDLDDPRYPAAESAFYSRHVCRLDPWPECMAKTGESLDGNQVYTTMNGPNEFTVVGSLRDLALRMGG